MKNQHPIVQILVRAVWIYIGALIFLFLLTRPQGLTFTSDPIRGYLGCVIVSTIVQAFKKSNSQAQPRQGRTAYQAKYSKLVNMVGGDKPTADRLIAAYGIDEAISDLERDRRIN